MYSAYLLFLMLCFCYSSHAVAFYPYDIDNHVDAGGATYITKTSNVAEVGDLMDISKLEIRAEKPRAVPIEDISFGVRYTKHILYSILRAFIQWKVCGVLMILKIPFHIYTELRQKLRHPN